jgi:hypothetical protein
MSLVRIQSPVVRLSATTGYFSAILSGLVAGISTAHVSAYDFALNR